MGRELRAIGDRHADASEALTNLVRALGDIDTTLIQTSAGTAEDAGSSSRSYNSDFRRRQQELARFRARQTPVLEDDRGRRQRQLKVFELAARWH